MGDGVDGCLTVRGEGCGIDLLVQIRVLPDEREPDTDVAEAVGIGGEVVEDDGDDAEEKGHRPDDADGDARRSDSEALLAKREQDAEEAVDADEGHQEDGGLAAEEGDEGRDLAHVAGAPLLRLALPEVRLADVDVHDGEDQHVDTHQQVRDGQVGDQHRLHRCHVTIGLLSEPAQDDESVA